MDSTILIQQNKIIVKVFAFNVMKLVKLVQDQVLTNAYPAINLKNDI